MHPSHTHDMQAVGCCRVHIDASSPPQDMQAVMCCKVHIQMHPSHTHDMQGVGCCRVHKTTASHTHTRYAGCGALQGIHTDTSLTHSRYADCEAFQGTQTTASPTHTHDMQGNNKAFTPFRLRQSPPLHHNEAVKREWSNSHILKPMFTWGGQPRLYTRQVALRWRLCSLASLCPRHTRSAITNVFFGMFHSSRRGNDLRFLGVTRQQNSFFYRSPIKDERSNDSPVLCLHRRSSSSAKLEYREKMGEQSWKRLLLARVSRRPKDKNSFQNIRYERFWYTNIIASEDKQSSLPAL